MKAKDLTETFEDYLRTMEAIKECNFGGVKHSLNEEKD